MVAMLVIKNAANYDILPGMFKEQVDIARVVLAQDGMALRLMPATIKGNKLLVMLAISQNRQAFYFGTMELQEGRDVREMYYFGQVRPFAV